MNRPSQIISQAVDNSDSIPIFGLIAYPAGVRDGDVWQIRSSSKFLQFSKLILITSLQTSLKYKLIFNFKILTISSNHYLIITQIQKSIQHLEIQNKNNNNNYI